jgi:gas vesicle protein
MGFVLGLLLGAVGALLYAPKNGGNTREELQLRADELKKRADDLQRIAQKIADDVSVKGREIIEGAKREWQRQRHDRRLRLQVLVTYPFQRGTREPVVRPWPAFFVS